MNHQPVSHIKVSIDFDGENHVAVGRLATKSGRIYFEYDDHFLTLKLNISPFKMPLKSGLQSFDSELFNGFPSVFDDSLPDGWGRLLFDHSMRGKGLLPQEIMILPFHRARTVSRAPW